MTNQQKDITEEDVINGLKNKEFFLAFQPIMNIKTDSFETFESFVRWQHPVYGELVPADFILKIQKYNLSEQLTEQIIDCAIAQILNNHHAGYGETGVNINLTVQEFLNPFTLHKVSEAIQKIPSPVFLGLEISSRILNMYYEKNPIDEEYHPDYVPSDEEQKFLLDIKNTCDKYSALGVTLALDTTDNIIGSLIRADILGLHALKMSTRSLDTPEIIEQYAQASKDFCIPVIAMGIENADLFQAILDNNIMYAQGSFFCKPLVLNNPALFKSNLDNYYRVKTDLTNVQKSRDTLKQMSKDLSNAKNDFLTELNNTYHHNTTEITLSNDTPQDSNHSAFEQVPFQNSVPKSKVLEPTPFQKTLLELHGSSETQDNTAQTTDASDKTVFKFNTKPTNTNHTSFGKKSF